MHFLCRLSLAASVVGLTIAGAQAADTAAGLAAKDAAQASGHASGSAAHSIAASGRVTSAASAVPLGASGAVAGSVGAASTAAAGDSMRAATAPIGTPLQVTDEAITVMPPNEALKAPAKAPAR